MQAQTVTSGVSRGRRLRSEGDRSPQPAVDDPDSPPAKRMKTEGTLGNMVDTVGAQALQRADSVEDFARTFAPDPDASTESGQLFERALQQAAKELGAMHLCRSNRPSVARWMQSHPQAVAPSRDLSSIRDEVVALLRQRINRSMKQSERWDAAGEVHLRAYGGTCGCEAQCDEHLALLWGILRREGVSANRLLPIQCVGVTQSSLAVGHVFLLYSDVDLPKRRPMSDGDITRHLQSHAGGCRVIDFWSVEKDTRLQGGADALQALMRRKLTEVHSAFDPSTLVWEEAQAPE